ncbi:MAG: hypothetical protein Q8P24_12535 [Desulfobacterales bacterium]|nr:hypothetical protein [Desulfobacterales bacterium]
MSWRVGAGAAIKARPMLLLMTIFTIFLGCQGIQSVGRASAVMPMGSPEDVNYAGQLWSVLEKERFVGANEVKLNPFVGAAKPHGWILELAYRNITVVRHTGFVVVKKNYDGPKLSVDDVKADRKKYLSSITVMFQREKGYDEDNKNWFWVKYKPDGGLFTKEINRKDVPLAGRIIKGKTREDNLGCIYCHSSAGGGDYIFYPQIIIPATGTEKAKTE